MANVSFNEEPQQARTVIAAKDPLFVRLLIGWGVAKNRRSAEFVLIALAVIALALAVFLFPKGRGEPELDVPMAGPQSTQTR